MKTEVMEYDYITPPHYKTKDGDYIDKLAREKGIQRAINFCEDSAGKYLERLGKKPGEPEERERNKIAQYQIRAAMLRGQLATEELKSKEV